MGQTIAQLFDEANKVHIEAHASKNAALYHEAFNRYNAILNQVPTEPSVLFSVATVAHGMGLNGLSINLFEDLLTREDTTNKTLIWNNLGSAYKGEHDEVNAKRCWEQALKLNPAATEYYNNLATLYINQGNPKPGIELGYRAVELDHNNANAHWNLSLCLLEDGQWEQGIQEYEAGLLTGDRVSRYYSVVHEDVPYWNGQDLKGKTIVVFGEQGIGDELMFAETIRELIATGAKVIIDCHDRLEQLMRSSFPECEVFPTRKKREISWATDRKIDFRVAMGSLFYRFRRDGIFPRTPYLAPDPKKVDYYKQRLQKLGPGPYVGIGYEGGAKKTHAHYRSFKLTPLKPILELPATFISLQYTKGAQEKWNNYERDTGVHVHHWPEVVESHLDDAYTQRSPGFNYSETAALVAALDAVVVPCTAVAHTCGAIGKDAYVLTPNACAWRYRSDDDYMRFYHRGVKLYREGDDWDEAIKRVASDLNDQLMLLTHTSEA